MLFYTPTTYPGQGTAQEDRPGLGGALTYAATLTYALYGHVPWTRSGAPRRLWRPKLRDDLRVAGLDHLVLYDFHLPWPWEQWERPL